MARERHREGYMFVGISGDAGEGNYERAVARLAKLLGLKFRIFCPLTAFDRAYGEGRPRMAKLACAVRTEKVLRTVGSSRTEWPGA